MTQKDLAERSGLSPAFISAVQRGLRVPEPDAEAKLAAAVGYPVSLLRLPRSRVGVGISVNMFRKQASSLKKHITRLEAKAVLCRIQAEGLMREAELRFPHDLERLDLDDFPSGDPADVATLTRSAWHLPSGPVQNLLASVERAGVIVFKFSFGTRKIDGMSQWLDGGLPLLFVNADAPADRVRFSLAHELGHLVLHERPTETMEDEANAFASSFLMPRQDIRRDLFDLTLEKAARLKPKWRVSMWALVRRARDLGCISPARYKGMVIQMSKQGWKKAEPYPIAPETPTTIDRVVTALRDQSGFTWGEIEAITHLFAEEAQTVLFRPRGGFMRIAS
jgi:Zn-dependent peptidase ImmA (M78 family)